MKQNAFDSFYANPTPLGALNLAIVDAMATKMPGEFVDNLIAAREQLLKMEHQIRELQDALRDSQFTRPPR